MGRGSGGNWGMKGGRLMRGDGGGVCDYCKGFLGGKRVESYYVHDLHFLKRCFLSVDEVVILIQSVHSQARTPRS